MFEFGQDIALLHGAFLSAGRAENKGSTLDSFCTIDESKLERISQIVSSSVQKIWLLDIYSITDKKVLLNKVTKNRRMHAVIFLSVLKSSGIYSDSADEFYETILNLLPGLSWKFYVQLNTQCGWSDYFVECVIQLPDNIFTVVMKNILGEYDGKNPELDLLHCVSQAIIKKLFLSKNLVNLPKSEHPFNFNFLVSDCSKEMNINAPNTVSLNCLNLSDILKTIYEYIACESNPEADVNITKLLIQAVITISKSFVESDIRDTDINLIMEELSDIINYAEKYLLTDSCKDLIKTAMLNFKSECLQKQFTETISGSSEESYMIFIFYWYWKMSFQKVSHILPWHKIVGKIAEDLYLLHPINQLEDEAVLDEHVKLLLFIIQRELPVSQYALQLILQNEKFLDRVDVFNFLEKLPCLLTQEHLISLINKTRKMNFNKNMYIQFILDLYEKLPTKPKNEILEYVFQTYSIDCAFKLQSFEGKLLAFLNYTVTLEQAEQAIGPLCLQSAEEVLRSIIQQAVRNGAQSAVLVQALNFVSSVCQYKQSESHSTLLVQHLQPFFSLKNLQPVEAQNIELLITIFIEKGDEPLFPLDEFFDQCLLENISVDNIDNLILCLNILNVCLKSKKCNILEKLQTKCLTMLSSMLMQTIDFSIVTSNGKLKDNVLTSLQLLISLDDKCIKNDVCLRWLTNFVAKMNPLTELYSLKLLQKEIDPTKLSLPHLWVWFCINKEDNISILDEKLFESNNNNPYIPLVSTLASNLIHFTAPEWLHSSLLIEKLLELPSFKSEVFLDFEAWNLSESNMKLSVIIRCLIESILLMKSDELLKLPWAYVINCFTNVIKNCLNQVSEVSPPCLILIFWEVSFLASSFNPVEMALFRPVLLDLLRKMNLEKEDKVTLKLVTAAVKNLPQCSDTLSLLEQLK